jgi:hypothetical protein
VAFYDVKETPPLQCPHHAAQSSDVERRPSPSDGPRKEASSMSQTPGGQTPGNYAAVNGLEMYYEIHGTGEPLVVLHGSFMTIELMGKLIPNAVPSELGGEGAYLEVCDLGSLSVR